MDRLNVSFVAEPQAVPAARNALQRHSTASSTRTSRRKLRLLVSELLAQCGGPRQPAANRLDLHASVHARRKDPGPGAGPGPGFPGRQPEARAGSCVPKGGVSFWSTSSLTAGVCGRAPSNELWFELDVANAPLTRPPRRSDATAGVA